MQGEIHGLYAIYCRGLVAECDLLCLGGTLVKSGKAVAADRTHKTYMRREMESEVRREFFLFVDCGYQRTL